MTKMHTIPELLDMAKKRNGFSSDRQLALALGHSNIAQYRTRGVVPNDETALKLAELCGLPAERVLLTCHVWRLKQTKGGEAPARVFMDMLRKLAAGIVLALVLALPYAGRAASSVHRATGCDIHYATLRIRRRLAAIAAMLRPRFCFAT